MDTELALLNQKLDHLTELIETQNRREQAFDELKDDMVPIVNHMIKLTINELAEIGSDFQLEDLLFLLKRILRDTNLLLTTLERLEVVSGLADEVQLLSKQVFNQTVVRLEQLERDGYFDFGRNGFYVTGQLVKEVKAEDMRALGDNMGAILAIVRKLNQPEFLHKTDQAAVAISTAPEEKVSVWAFVRGLFDPQVRKGLARMLNVVKAFA
jgi:uncharacterized protein YjgD (DUF1641 family)